MVSRFDLSGGDFSFVSALIRLAPDGPFAQNFPFGIATDTNGRLLAGTFGVGRLNADGSLDKTVVTNGIVRYLGQ